VGRIVSRKNIVSKFWSLAYRQAGLGSPKAVVVSFSVVFMALAVIPTAFLGQPGSLCIWHRFVLPWIFHNYCPQSGLFANCLCPGCGITHAMSRLLHGDIIGAYNYNHLIYIVAAVVIIVYITNIIKLIKK